MLKFEVEKTKRLNNKLERELGHDLLRWLDDKEVVEIMLNPDGYLWIDHQKQGLIKCHKMLPQHAHNLIGTVASMQQTLVNETKPILECALPLGGSRFEALIPPITSDPIFCIRKKAEKVFTLEDYLSAGIIKQGQVEGLRRAIKERKTIIVAGGPGTGKTTFANALLNEMVTIGELNQRIVILEETRELQCVAPNTVFLQTTDTVDYQQLLRATLRLRPDKICMGECRGKEMLTLLKSWNTGTPGGLATIHANTAQSALLRIQEMIAESGSFAQPQLIVEAVNIIVSLNFHPIKGREVRDIVELTDYNNQQFQTQPF